MNLFGQPPDDFPDNLTAKEYFLLGAWYEQAHKKALAKRAYERVTELEPEGPQAREAKRLLDVDYNVEDVPQSVIDSLFRAELQISFRPQQSREIVTQILKDYPQSDGAHRLMGQLFLGDGALEKSLEELQIALSINPKSVQSLALMSRVQAATFNYTEAYDCVLKALVISPEAEDLKLLRRAIEGLMAAEDEICPIEEQVNVVQKRLQNLTSK